MTTHDPFDAIIIGAGAAGLFCAWQAGLKGRKILLLDHSGKIAEKIRISGGGRCNFTNIHSGPKNFISENPKFCISALKRFPPRAFIDLVEQAGIPWFEKTLGQLFCETSADDIITMLLSGCRQAGVTIEGKTLVQAVTHHEGALARYQLDTTKGLKAGRQLVIATGGLSIPKIGATDFGYRIARQFDQPIIPTRPGLVPLTFSGALLEALSDLRGLSLPARVSAGTTPFDEALLFTHRGLSGPAILQASSYWREGEPLRINLLPNDNAQMLLIAAKEHHPKQKLKGLLEKHLPNRLADKIATEIEPQGLNLADLNNKVLNRVAERLNNWTLTPAGTEGYRTAEVTLGGVDTKALSSQSMEAKSVPGLYFIGEVVDVTGHLGGHNFQWAWASAKACAEAL